MIHVEETETGYRRVTHEAAEHEFGYDGAVFEAGAFERLVRSFELEREVVGDAFVWYNSSVLLVTAADPLTGEYPLDEDREPGFAGYMGLEGTKDAMREVSKFLIHNAEYEQKHYTEREYI